MYLEIYYTVLGKKETYESESGKFFNGNAKPTIVMTRVNLCFTCAVKEVIKGNHVDSHIIDPEKNLNTDRLSEPNSLAICNNA